MSVTLDQSADTAVAWLRAQANRICLRASDAMDRDAADAMADDLEEAVTLAERSFCTTGDAA